jgi:hypothetical protein
MESMEKILYSPMAPVITKKRFSQKKFFPMGYHFFSKKMTFSSNGTSLFFKETQKFPMGHHLFSKDITFFPMGYHFFQRISLLTKKWISLLVSLTFSKNPEPMQKIIFKEIDFPTCDPRPFHFLMGHHFFSKDITFFQWDITFFKGYPLFNKKVDITFSFFDFFQKSGTNAKNFFKENSFPRATRRLFTS